MKKYLLLSVIILLSCASQRSGNTTGIPLDDVSTRGWRAWHHRLPTGGEDLLIFRIGLGEERRDIKHNLKLMDRIGFGINADTEKKVALFDTSGTVFVQIYTKTLRDHFGRLLLDPLGFAFKELSTMALSARLSETTVAHELCHNFGLDHTNDPNNLMHETISRTSYDLVLTQIMKVKDTLRKYPREFIRPEGY